MTNQWALIPMLWLSATLASSGAKAADLYNNLSQSPITISGVSNSYLNGLSFATTATDVVLNTVTIPIWNNLSFTSGTADIYLYDATNSGALPGNQMASLGSAPMTSFSSAGYQNLTLSNLNVNLQPSTNYWIVLGGTNLPASYTIGMTNLSTGAGPGSIGSAVFSGGWQGQSGWFIIGSVTAQAVPEPSTMALAGIAAIVALLVAPSKSGNRSPGLQHLSTATDFEDRRRKPIHFGPRQKSRTPVFLLRFRGPASGWLDAAMSFLQHMGATIRHIAAEARPLARYIFNHLDEGIGPGMKRIAQAVKEGLKKGQG